MADLVSSEEMKSLVASIILNHNNRPMKALWWALNDKTNISVDIPMAIIMDPRCGIECRADEEEDELWADEGFPLHGATPLIMAVHAGRNDVIEALLAAGADHDACDGDGSTPLMVAAGRANLTAIHMFEGNGANSKAVDPRGNSALHYAAGWNGVTAIEALLRLGMDLEASNNDGKAPLSFSVISSCETLLGHGANISLVDLEGNTALHDAARNGDIIKIEILLRLGADVEAVDGNGRTSLHWAAARGHSKAVEELYHQRADLRAIDKAGHTPNEAFQTSLSYCSAEQERIIKSILAPEQMAIS